MDSYRIEKQRLAVTLTLVGGGSLHGHIFVQPSAHGHRQYEDPYEDPVRVLNGTEPFFPLATDTGEVTLVAKERVEEVRGTALVIEDELRRASARAMQLEVRLASGSVHAGSVLAEMPSQQPRPLDFLNQHDKRFLTLHTNEGVRLINTRQIDSVRPLD